MKSICLTLGFMLPLMTACLHLIQGQQSFTVAGGDLSGSGGTISYSVGQVAWNQVYGASGSMAQGVQQPYEIMVVTGTDETAGILQEMKIFPNPSTDHLFLSIPGYGKEPLHYSLVDLNGRVISTEAIKAHRTEIPMGSYPSSAYQLIIYNATGKINVFQIIKHR